MTLNDASHSQIRAELAALGEQRRSLRQQQAALRAAIRTAVVDADDAELSITEIAQLVGLTRAAVYHLLDEAEGDE